MGEDLRKPRADLFERRRALHPRQFGCEFFELPRAVQQFSKCPGYAVQLIRCVVGVGNHTDVGTLPSGQAIGARARADARDRRRAVNMEGREPARD